MIIRKESRVDIWKQLEKADFAECLEIYDEKQREIKIRKKAFCEAIRKAKTPENCIELLLRKSNQHNFLVFVEIILEYDIDLWLDLIHGLEKIGYEDESLLRSLKVRMFNILEELK